MKITNLYNLPETFVNAVRNDPYSKGDADYSVTELIAPVRQVLLKHRHWDEIEEDVSERMWSLLGQALHHILDRAGNDNALREERIAMTVLGRKISGAADLYADRKISDYKVTSAWTAVFGSRKGGWEQQLNLYTLLFESMEFGVDELEVVCLYRDWSATNAKRDPEHYPQRMVGVVPLKLWPMDERRSLVAERLGALIAAEPIPDSALPFCTAEEMWEKPSTWAAMKNGRKSAVRVCETEAQAQAYVTGGQATHVELRPGERTRCERYCLVSKFCNQYAAYLATKPSAEREDGQ